MGVLNAVFPSIPVCVVCGVEKGVVSHLCPVCSGVMERLEAGYVKALALDAYSCYRYEGAAADIIKAYKYGGARWMSAFIAKMIMHTVCDSRISWDIICNVPLHEKKRKSRGFDQSELIAVRLSEYTGKPYHNALRRTRNTPSQTRLDWRQRRENMEGAFEAEAAEGNVLLIDDVLTTGATVAECAQTLARSGAGSVTVATFAHAETVIDSR
ncbi:MAG: ComF family protein [Christensenellales bacterium]